MRCALEYHTWDATRPDDEDSDSDFEEPVEDAGDNENEGYDDWAAIEAEFGLLAWDKLGEGFEQEIADIGMFREYLCYTFKLIVPMTMQSAGPSLTKSLATLLTTTSQNCLMPSHPSPHYQSSTESILALPIYQI